MWKDDRKRRIIRNIIIAVLWLALLFALVKVVMEINARSSAEDQALVDAQQLQQQAQTAAKDESVVNIQLEYEKDMDTLREYLPGIVCWGDSLTYGSAGNVSYPSVLQKYINTYLCDMYNFALSVPDAVDYGRLDWGSFTMSVPVVNMGAGSESAETVLGRAGVLPYVTYRDFTVPADTVAVPINIQSQNGRDVTPLTGNVTGGVNPVVINGIEGVLSVDPATVSTYNLPTYYFTRSQPGQETVIPSGSVISVASADAYKDYIHIVFIGNYGSYYSLDDVVKQARQLVDRQTKNSDRYIVVGPCTYYGQWNVYTSNLSVMDAAMTQEFGNRYINFRKYLCEDGITDSGIDASDRDKDFARQSIVPECFRSTNGTVEFNSKGYELLGRLIYDRMDKLGFFDEIKQELFIDQSTKAVLKEDPNYFENMMQSGSILLR